MIKPSPRRSASSSRSGATTSAPRSTASGPTSCAGTGRADVQTLWLDTVGGAYPVCDRRFTYPDEAAGAARRTWTMPEDRALVGSGGHLHPGRLWTDLALTRDGRSTRLFWVYYEPARAVSWDVSMPRRPVHARGVRGEGAEVAPRSSSTAAVSASSATPASGWRPPGGSSA